MARDQIEGHYRVPEMVRTFLVHQVYPTAARESEYEQEETQRSVGLTGLLEQRRQRGSRWVPWEVLLPLVLGAVY